MPPSIPIATPPNASASRTDTGTALSTAPYQASVFLDIGPTVHPITRTEISVPSQPIQLTVNTDTDWVAAFVTPVTVGLAAAYIAWLNQRNSIRSAESLQQNSITSAEALHKLQYRSARATFRQTWLVDFRTFAATYVSIAGRLNLKNVESPGHVHTASADDLLIQMATARASMRMMLDSTKTYTVELVKIMDEVTDSLFSNDPAARDLTADHLKRFIDKAQEVQERAWQDIKRELS